MPMGSKDAKRGKTNKILFGVYSNGLKSRRDAWVYNVSKKELEINIKTMIDYWYVFTSCLIPFTQG